MQENAELIKPEILNTELIVASCALVVSIVSTGLAVWTAFLQRRHMQLSVMPIASILVGDWENRLVVSLKNTGVGPLVVKSLRIFGEGDKPEDNLILHMPELDDGLHWDTYQSNIDGETFPPGEVYKLIELTGDTDDDAFKASRDRVRKALAKLRIEVEYKDLYGRKMPISQKALTWFARHDLLKET